MQIFCANAPPAIAMLAASAPNARIDRRSGSEVRIVVLAMVSPEVSGSDPPDAKPLLFAGVHPSIERRNRRRLP
jgi:hypothetical protein